MFPLLSPGGVLWIDNSLISHHHERNLIDGKFHALECQLSHNYADSFLEIINANFCTQNMTRAAFELLKC